MSYRIVVERPAERFLRRRASPENAVRIRQAIDELAEEPRPRNSLTLRGREGRRLRVGDYRIIYEVDDGTRTVTITAVGHRRDVYR